MRGPRLNKFIADPNKANQLLRAVCRPQANTWRPTELILVLFLRVWAYPEEGVSWDFVGRLAG